ncbi:MAG: metallopeptidase family protein [Dehalococcoidia bacterium]|nr:metallopeptidase family protein [Dehalococcoidia bacterium]
MDREKFEGLVAKAVDDLPEEFLTEMDNVVVMVEDYPSHRQKNSVGLQRDETLLGLYEGVPQTMREHYGLVPPDKITIFQKPIEGKCRSDADITAEVEEVVKHEIAHHFGIDDARLEQIAREKGKS